MKTIHKFQLTLGENTIRVDPEGDVVAFQMQNGRMCAWIELDDLVERKEVKLYILGTGHPIPPSLTHQGTLQDGGFVWHLYRSYHRDEADEDVDF